MGFAYVSGHKCCASCRNNIRSEVVCSKGSMLSKLRPCVLILLHICVLIPLYHRNEVAVLETEHAVKFEALEALLLEVVL